MSRPDPERVAVALSHDSKVVAVGRGAEAQRIVEKAQAAGVEVRRDPEKVEEVLRGANRAVPPEIYELMATVIDFAQELSEARLTGEVRKHRL